MLIIDLLSAAFARWGSAVAVESETDRLTYAELDARSAMLASQLRELGVGPDHLVGIYCRQSADAIVGFLAVTRAGGAFVPLDLNYPPERLAMMLEDARPNHVLVDEATQGAPLLQGRSQIL